MAWGILAAGAARLLGKSAIGKGLGGLIKRAGRAVKKIVPKGTAARVAIAGAATYALARPGSGVSAAGIGRAVSKAAGDIVRSPLTALIPGVGLVAQTIAQRMGGGAEKGGPGVDMVPFAAPQAVSFAPESESAPVLTAGFAPAATMQGSPATFQQASLMQGGIPGAIVRGIGRAAPYAAGSAAAEYFMNRSSSGGGGAYRGKGGIAQAAVTQGIAHGDIKLIEKPQKVERLVAPAGYVLVVDPAGHTHAVLAEVAYALGMKKRPVRGGGISRRDIARARHVQKVIQKLTVKREPKFKLRATARVAGGRK